MYIGGHLRPLLRSLITIAAILLVVAGASQALVGPGGPADSAHSTAALGVQSAVNADHVQTHWDSPVAGMNIVLSQWLPEPAALPLIGVLVAAVGGYALTASRWRGPPCKPRRVITGRDTLTQLCLARR